MPDIATKINNLRVYIRNIRKSSAGKQNLMLPARERRGTPKYYLSVVAFAKDEADYLEEWINFHLLVGCEHIYFYDNESSDDTLEVLEKYVRRGLVTYSLWKKSQKQAYYDVIKKYADDSQWMLFIDLDEFVFPANEDSLKGALKYLEGSACVVLPWHMFGDDGHEKQPQGLVIENYRNRSRIPNKKASANLQKKLTHTKCIVDPFKVKTVGVHMFSGRAGYETVMANGTSWGSEEWHPSEKDSIVLNHYYTKSKQELNIKLEKKARRHKREKIPKPLEEKIESTKKIADAINHDKVEDLRVQRFLEPLKKAMQNNE